MSQENTQDRIQETLRRAMHNEQVHLEHYGVFPLQLIDRIITVVNNDVDVCLEELQKYISENSELHPCVSGSNGDCTQEMFSLDTYLHSKVDVIFDEFDLYLQKTTFKIPDGVYVPLPHQSEYEPLISDEQELNDLIQETEKTQQRLMSIGYLRKFLKYYNQKLSVELKKLQSSVDFNNEILKREPDLEDLIGTFKLTRKIINFENN